MGNHPSPPSGPVYPPPPLAASLAGIPALAPLRPLPPRPPSPPPTRYRRSDYAAGATPLVNYSFIVCLLTNMKKQLFSKKRSALFMALFFSRASANAKRDYSNLYCVHMYVECMCRIARWHPLPPPSPPPPHTHTHTTTTTTNIIIILMFCTFIYSFIVGWLSGWNYPLAVLCQDLVSTIILAAVL